MTAASIPDDRPADRPPRGGGELRSWAWHLSRASALLLVLLVPLHFVVTFLHDDVGRTTARSISARLDDPTWRLLTWLTLALALVHGTIAAQAGLRRRVPGAAGTALTVLVGLVAGSGLAALSWVLATRWV